MSSETSSPSILVVEDNVLNQKLIVQILLSFGFQSELAENGEEALAILERAYENNSHPFSLILMDLQMPIMDGFMTTKAIREKESPYQSIPIIGLSANSEEEVAEQIDTVGMNGYVTKPIEIPKLLSVIQHHQNS